jgi:hypothetical protein
MAEESVRLQRRVTAPTAVCLRWAVSSSAVHRRYQRHLTALAWGTRAVRIPRSVRKFRCRTRACGRGIFTARRPALGAAYGRHTPRLTPALRALGLALGGKTGARLAARRRLPTRPSTRLRLVRGAPIPPTPALQVVGVDAWAWRRGHHDGTILVALATPGVVDLRPERSAASVAAWLTQHPTLPGVCRDRRDLDADGMRRGAPEAVQVVDRFPLVQNLRQALEAFLIAPRAALQAAAGGTAMARTPPTGVAPITPLDQGGRCGRGARPSPAWPASGASGARPSTPPGAAPCRPA